MERETVRSVQLLQGRDGPACFPTVLRVGQSQHRAVIGVADQEHAAGSEGHEASARGLTEYGDVKALRQLEPADVEGIGVAAADEQERQKKDVQFLHSTIRCIAFPRPTNFELMA